jgi:hypothetical protein
LRTDKAASELRKGKGKQAAEGIFGFLTTKW